MLVCFEPGVYMARTKTNKPAGKRLRRWLVSEVLPQLRETGS
jgi:prophage antirepressor-like protein